MVFIIDEQYLQSSNRDDVPCSCHQCRGACISQQLQQQHMDRERRQLSIRPPATTRNARMVTFANTGAPTASIFAQPAATSNFGQNGARRTQQPASFATHITPVQTLGSTQICAGDTIGRNRGRETSLHSSNSGPASNLAFHGSPLVDMEPPSTPFLSTEVTDPPINVPLSTASSHSVHACTPCHPLPLDYNTESPVARNARIVSFRSASPLIAAAEQRGLEHFHRMEKNPEVQQPIADDDWEQQEEEADTAHAGNVDLPPSETNVCGSDENSPDPFQYSPGPVRPPPTAADIHPERAVYILYLFVFWLHTQFHLPFRACSAFLAVITLAFEAAGSPIDPPMHTTLPSVISKLEAEPSFKVCPVCPGCLEVHPASVPKDACCTRCEHPLYRPPVTPSKTAHRAEETRRPYLQFPMKSLEEQVAAMLAIPGVEDQMDHWRMKARVAGEYNDIFDGRVCQELEGADGLPFFRHDLDHLPNGELRIGLTLGVDWSVYTMASYSAAGLTIAYRFSYLRSQISASHTSGPMSFSIINLPPHLRSVSYDCDNIA